MKASLTLLSFMFLVSTVVVAQDYNKGLKKELEDIEEMYPAKKVKASKVAVTKVKVQEVQEADSSDVVQDSSSDVVVAGPQLPANIEKPAAVVTTTTTAVAAQPVSQAVAAAPQVAQQAVPQNGQQPIYILQQPTTNVEAAPLKESRAEQMRRQREEIEHQNEMKLIERIEDERLNAEKERSEKIMAPFAKPEQVAPAGPVQGPAAVVVPVQQEVVPAAGTQNADSKDGVLKAAIIANKIEEKKEEKKYLVGVLGGAGSYPSVSNVSGAFALGGSFEMRFPSRIGIEGSTTYSSYDIQNANTCPNCVYGTPLVTTMTQWDFSGGFNFAVFKTAITPVVGVLLDYTRRDYASRVTYGYGNPSFTGSNAFAGGFLAGFEVQVSDNLIIGGSLKYMFNISYRTDNPLAYGAGGYVYNVGTPIESLNYYNATLNTKLLF